MNLELSEQHRQLVDTFRAFSCETLRPAGPQIDSEGRLPAAVLEGLAQRGWLDAGELDTLGVCLLIEELARENGSVGLAIGAHLLTVLQPLVSAGVEPPATGLGAAALPQADGELGLAELAVRATGVESGFLLNGEVEGVAAAMWADHLLIPAVLDGACAVFRVSGDRRGVVIDAAPPALGLAAAGRATVRFDQVEVAAAERVAGLGSADWLQRWVGLGRLAMAAVAVGVGQGAFEDSLEALTNRAEGPEAAGQSLQFYLADISTEVDAARLLTWKAAWALAARIRVGPEPAQAKLFATEAAQKATDLALQIAGDDGYRSGSEFDRRFRDARSLELFHGAREAQKRVIAGLLVDED